MRTVCKFMAMVILAFGGSVPYWVRAQVTAANDNIRIAWDHSSIQLLAEKGGYPRMIRLQDGTLLLVYETRTGDIHLKRSTDEGANWTTPVAVFSQFVYSNLDGETAVVYTANPEIKQLHNGDIVIACNYRPRQAEVAPYTIVLRRSEDNGNTWLAPQNLYTAAPRFNDGCWEPSFLQLPSGELQVYFANENPYQQSDEQEISLLRSFDNGATWTDTATTVSFRKDRRDGMPVAEVINDEIVVVIEDNKVGHFKPYTLRSSLKENWSSPILADSPNRTYALAEQIPDTVYKGAPYLLKLPQGQTLISYQTTENRAADWERSTMEVAIGSASATGFAQRSRPFPVPLDSEAKWNALMLWDEHTVAALTSSNFRSPEVAPWMIKGYIIPATIDITLRDHLHPIFVGATGQTNVKTAVQSDKEHLYINCLLSEAEDRCDSLGAELAIFLHRNGHSWKICLNDTGWKSTSQRVTTQWKPVGFTSKIQIDSTASPLVTAFTMSIPKTLLADGSLDSFQLGLALSTYDILGQPYTEYLADMDEADPNTWLNIKL